MTKSNAERQREYRERRKTQPVDNPNARYESLRDALRNVTEIVTEIRNEIAEIRDALIVITPLSGPSAPSREGGGVTRNESRNASRNGNPRRDYDLIHRCSRCDNNGFIASEDETGAPIVHICSHA